MLRFEKIEVLCADLFDESAIPDVKNPNASVFFKCDDTVDEEQKERIGKGMLYTILPYKLQDRYSRDMKNKEFNAAILENEYIKAAFLPELGGRLISLYHKKEKKHLVYEADNIKFANLALCNAWFAGGIEWNVGMKGHSPFTCRPLFTLRAKGVRGNDILRMYEYEEIRGLVWNIEATLYGEELLIKVEIKNAKNEDTYTYWWSNVAVAERDATVYIPAKKTYEASYREGGYHVSKTPVKQNICTPEHTCVAKDYFYDMPVDKPKWMAVLNSDGTGLLQYSNDTLIGRKSFFWGTSVGGSNWNKWLCEKENYFEVQAGICKTQFEHMPLKAEESISWIESYSLINVGSHSFEEQCNLINSDVARRAFPEDIFVEAHHESPEVFGSARGYLTERLHNKRLSEKLEFPKESVTEEYSYYLDVLNGDSGVFNSQTAFVYDPRWIELIGKKQENSYFDYYIISLIQYANGHFAEAIKAIEESLRLKTEPYTLFTASLLALHLEMNREKAYEYASTAINMRANDIRCARLFGEICISTENYDAFIRYYNALNDEMKSIGRLRLYVGNCLCAVGRIDEAEMYINEELVIPDIREGEYSLSNVWIEMYRKKLAAELGLSTEEVSDDDVLQRYPIPCKIDFRMH